MAYGSVSIPKLDVPGDAGREAPSVIIAMARDLFAGDVLPADLNGKIQVRHLAWLT